MLIKTNHRRENGCPEPKQHGVFTETHPERDESSGKLSDALTLLQICIKALCFNGNKASTRHSKPDRFSVLM